MSHDDDIQDTLVVPDTKEETDRADAPKKSKRRRRLVVLAMLLAIAIPAGIITYREYRTSALQADYFLEEAEQLTYSTQRPPEGGHLERDALARMRTVPVGPRDERLGYASSNQMLDRLTRSHFVTTSSASPSEALQTYAAEGFYPPYKEKLQAGLKLTDRHDTSLLESRFPRYVYPTYEAIPPLALQTLFFLENREMGLDKPPTYNYVLEWDRTLLSFWMLAKSKVTGADVHGGSTLATQWEKYTHTKGGRTDGSRDKLVQLYSASIRLYGLSGDDTERGRQHIAHYYVNHFPLGARPDLGEVHGLRDGFYAWYGLDPDEVDAALRGEKGVQAQGHALRHTAALFIGLRRPTALLARSSPKLPVMIDAAFGSMRDEGIISEELHAAATSATLEPLRTPPPASTLSPKEVVEKKAIDSFRIALANRLGVETQHDLERLDLSARMTLDVKAQAQVEELLVEKLRDPEFLKEHKFVREYGLRDGDPSKVHYSFILLEREQQRNKVRLEVDTLQKDFNFNRGARVDLGSTAKLRTLVTYLELVADLYDKWRPLSKKELVALDPHPRDRISHWVRHELYHRSKMTKAELVESALEQKYSAHPARFMTGGGMHVFHNFDKDTNGWNPNLISATRHSINLPFIRLMQDLVWHYRWDKVDASIIKDKDHPERRAYLERWVEDDAATYLTRFWKRYHTIGKDSPAALIERHRKNLTPVDFIAIYTYLDPEMSLETMRSRIDSEIDPTQRKLLKKLDDKDWQHHYERAHIDTLNLQDRGYIAELHPLELWIVKQLAAQPAAPFEELEARMQKEVRPEIYAWLTRGERTRTQNNKIYTLLEQDAFAAIQREWTEMGYPFDDLVPSLATALGSSGDRPESLSKLMGIIMADGMSYPVRRIEQISFGQGTPYGFEVDAASHQGRRVLHEEVAVALKEVLGLVVKRGTAVRARPLTEQPLFADLMGKTGTGDHTLKHRMGGQFVKGRTISRAGVFMYGFGEKYFGVLTVYVDGDEADDYTFTSSLTAQIFTHLAPIITEMTGRLEHHDSKPEAPSGSVALVDRPRTKPPVLARVIDPVKDRIMRAPERDVDDASSPFFERVRREDDVIMTDLPIDVPVVPVKLDLDMGE